MKLTYDEKCGIVLSRMNIGINSIIDEVAVCKDVHEAADIYDKLAKFVRKTANTIDRMKEEEPNDS